MTDDGRQRVVIENVKPEIDGGRFPAKRVTGEKVTVSADIFSDGHDALSAQLLWKKREDGRWRHAPMIFIGNDRWQASFTVTELGTYLYTIEGWVDHFGTWRRDLAKKFDAGLNVSLELLAGLIHIESAIGRVTADRDREGLTALRDRLGRLRESDTEAAVSLALGKELAELVGDTPDRKLATRYAPELVVVVDLPKALFSTWYEFFPRSCPTEGAHGTFRDCGSLLPYIAEMGFDVAYLPPIHPIGRTKRKGKNNGAEAEPDDVGSPWAIGSEEGGHRAVHPGLGTMEDFEGFVKKAKEHGIDVALDLALQCSPDHPYVKEHPEWFRLRPDGTIQYAENPPKKYEDIFPLNFESEDWKALWEEIRRVVLFWIDKGVRIFRVDNPHTKPFAFWEWLIAEVKRDHPDVFFLAEAFTRPKIMRRLAKAGFAQSYTYFTWRYTRREFIEYLTELTRSDLRDFFRPNFWPNTPDILPEHLQYGGKPAFLQRYLLAATLSSNVGIYGPAFELCVSGAPPDKEEYLRSEKYEIKRWNIDDPASLRRIIGRINRIRREYPALQTTWNLEFFETDNDNILCYGKAGEDGSEALIIAVNMDPFHTQSAWVRVPVEHLGLTAREPYLVHDLIDDNKFVWEGERNFVEIDPKVMPGFIFRIRRKLRRENDFDYYG